MTSIQWLYPFYLWPCTDGVGLPSLTRAGKLTHCRTTSLEVTRFTRDFHSTWTSLESSETYLALTPRTVCCPWRTCHCDLGTSTVRYPVLEFIRSSSDSGSDSGPSWQSQTHWPLLSCALLSSLTSLSGRPVLLLLTALLRAICSVEEEAVEVCIRVSSWVTSTL